MRDSNHFITNKHATDKCIISDRGAVHILMATTKSFKFNVNSLINRSSTNRIRQTFCMKRMKNIRIF